VKAKVGHAIARLHRSLGELADELDAVGDRHAAEHDLPRLCSLLAGQCREQMAALAPHGARYGRPLRPPRGGSAGLDVLGAARRAGSALTKHRVESGLVLLRDLRRLHALLEEVSLLWLIVGQAARASRDRELLALVEPGRETTAVQVQWVTTRVKESAAQALLA
jgi:hypothetical protein